MRGKGCRLQGKGTELMQGEERSRSVQPSTGQKCRMSYGLFHFPVFPSRSVIGVTFRRGKVSLISLIDVW